MVYHAIGLGACHQVVALFQGSFHHLAAGIVGIGHQVARRIELQVVDEVQQLIQQGSFISIGEDQSLMDFDVERDGEQYACCLRQHRYRLRGMPHDERGFGIRFTRLVEAFDAGHLLARLGVFLPSANRIGRPLRRSILSPNRLSTVRVQRALSRDSLIAVLW